MAHLSHNFEIKGHRIVIKNNPDNMLIGLSKYLLYFIYKYVYFYTKSMMFSQQSQLLYTWAQKTRPIAERLS